LGVTSFSWRQVAVDTLVGAATAGIGEGFKALANSAKTAEATSRIARLASIFTEGAGESMKLTTWGRVAQGVGGYLSGVAANKIVNRDTNFSWGQVAATALSSYISAELNPSGSFEIFDEGSSLGRGLNRFAGEFFNGGLSATARRMAGGEKQNWNSIAINAASQVAGEGLSSAIEAIGQEGPSEFDVMPADNVSAQPFGDGQLMLGVDTAAEVGGAPSVPTAPAMGGTSISAAGRAGTPRRRVQSSAMPAQDGSRAPDGRPYAPIAVEEQLMRIDVYARSQRNFSQWSAQAVLDYVYPRYYNTNNPWALPEELATIEVTGKLSSEERSYRRAMRDFDNRAGVGVHALRFVHRYEREGGVIRPNYVAPPRTPWLGYASSSDYHHAVNRMALDRAKQAGSTLLRSAFPNHAAIYDGTARWSWSGWYSGQAKEIGNVVVGALNTGWITAGGGVPLMLQEEGYQALIPGFEIHDDERYGAAAVDTILPFVGRFSSVGRAGGATATETNLLYSRLAVGETAQGPVFSRTYGARALPEMNGSTGPSVEYWRWSDTVSAPSGSTQPTLGRVGYSSHSGTSIATTGDGISASWSMVPDNVANSGTKSAVADSMSGSGRVAAQAVDQSILSRTPRDVFVNRFPEDSLNLRPFDPWKPGLPANQGKYFLYVVKEDGTLVISTRPKRGEWGHVDLAQGQPVLAAGEGRYWGGFKMIDNASGHYRPIGDGARNAAIGAFRTAGYNVDASVYVSKVWSPKLKAWVPVESP
jgi:hypothetical protein